MVGLAPTAAKAAGGGGGRRLGFPATILCAEELGDLGATGVL